MRSARRLVLTLLTALTAITIACTDAGPPTSPSAGSPSFSRSKAQSAEGQQRHEELKKLLDEQKQRIKEERDLRKAEYLAARIAWKAYKREWKRVTKGTAANSLELLRCEPRPYDAEAAIIGPDGGTLDVGEHRLVIPKGALSREELLVAEAPTTSLVNVEFSPEGLTFERPAELTLSYKHCDVPAAIDLRLAYLGWGNRVLELPPSRDARDLSEVVGEIEHFSRYAVAY